MLTALPLGTSHAVEPVFDIDIPALNAAQALNSLAEQTGSVMLYSYDLARARQANAVRGRYTLLAGLELLLRDTGLSAGLSDKRVVIITDGGNEPTGKGGGVKKRSLFAGIAMVLTSAIAADASGDQAEDTKVTPTGLSEIVVTARRREDRLIDVPMSMDVVGAQTIIQRGLVNSEDYLREIPGVVQENIGYLGSQDITIRGIYSGGGNFGSGGTFASYFGEVPTSASAGITGTSTIDIKLVDISRVEVLRGPQGVAFGDASLGGAIRIMPNAPEIDALEGLVSGEFSQTGGSGGSNFRGHGTVNIPMGDRFALRAVAYRFDDAGYYRNRAGSDPDFQSGPVAIFGGQDFAVDRDHVGDTRTIGGRAALLFQVNENLDFTFNVLSQETEIDGVPIENNGLYTQTIFQVDPAQVRRGQVDGFADNSISIYNPVVTYNTKWGSLVASYSHMDSGSNSAQPFNIFGLNFPLSQGQDGDHTEDVGELRFASQLTGPLNFVLGAFTQKTEDSAVFDFYWFGTAGFPFPAGQVGLAELDRELRQNAVYGQAFWEIVPSLKLAVGARYYDYDRDFTDVRSGAFLGSVDFQGSTEANGVSPRVDLSYSPDADTTVYGSYSEGFRLGTPSAVLPAGVCDVDGDGLIDGTNVPLADTAFIGSDDIKNYELGLKSNLPSGVGSISLAIYHMDWTGIPTLSLAPCGLTYQINAGAAESDGIEVSSALYLAESLTLTLGVSFNNARYTETVPALGIPVGSRVGGTDVNGNIGVRYDFALGTRPAFARLDSLYVGYRGDPALGDPLEPYTTVDITTGINFNDFEVSLFARNLFDEDDLVSRMPEANGVDAGWRLTPRTFGLRLNYRFGR